MLICKACGVELEPDTIRCPLCETPVGNATDRPLTEQTRKGSKPAAKHKKALNRLLWQVTSLLLVFGALATLVINYSAHGKITWSLYPVTICLILLANVALPAFWNKTFTFQVTAGWILASFVLVGAQWFMNVKWPLQLAFPLLCATDAVVLVIYFSLKLLKLRNLNVLAVLFVGITLHCLLIEGIVSYYSDGLIQLQWSVIVAACLLPVAAATSFISWRTRKNVDLQKIFHT